MTDSHPFFRFVWRVNALLLCSLAGLAGLFLAYQVVRESFSGRAVYRAGRHVETPLPSPTDPASPNEVLHIGMFTRADGSVFHAPVFAGRAGDAYRFVSSIKGGGERVRNVMMFDAGTGTVTRLFPDDRGRILDEDVITRAREGAKPKVLARVYVYVAADTNGDGRLDGNDRQRVFVTRPDGSQPTVIADGIHRYLPAAPAEGKEATLSYFVREGAEMQYGEFDLDAFRPGRSVQVTMPRT